MDGRDQDEGLRRAPLAIALLVLVLLVGWVSCGEHGTPRRAPAPGVAPTDGGADEVRVPPAPERAHVAATEAPGEEPAKPPSLRVRVTLPGGAGLPDVEIQVAEEPPSWREPPAHVVGGTTGPDGGLTLPLYPGAYQIRGRHADVMVLGDTVEHPSDGVVELHAGPGPRLVITVVDREGTPVPGAVVWERHALGGHVVLTDEEGGADLGRVYPFNPMVHVVADGLAPWSNYAFGAWDGSDVVERRVQLSPAVKPSIVGVLEHDGTSAAGARVTFSGGETVTGPAGRATMRVVRYPSYARAEAPDGRGVRLTLSEPPPEGQVLEMRLPPPRPLRGRIVHAWTGAPVPGATVVTWDDGWHEVARSDENGCFTLAHADPDDLSLVAFSPGLGPTGEDWTSSPGPDADGVIVLPLSPAMRVSGRAVDADGEPVSGATAEAIVYGNSPPLGVRPPGATTGADGAFTIEGVPAVPRVMAMVTGATGIGWSDLDLEVPAAPDAAFDVGDVLIPRGFDLDVPVTDDDGVALPAAVVWVRWRIVARGMPSEHRLVVDGKMDPVLGIPRSSAVAEINGPGILDTVVRIDATTTSLVADRPCIVRGRLVRAETGEPIEGVWVIAESKDRLHTLDGNNEGMKTLADGSFELLRLRRGRYGLRARTDDHARFKVRPATVDVTSREVDVGDLLVE